MIGTCKLAFQRSLYQFLHLLFPNKIFIFLLQTFISIFSYFIILSFVFPENSFQEILTQTLIFIFSYFIPPLADLLFPETLKMSQYSSSSFNGSTLRQKSGLVCHCGVESPLVTAWTEENPGRRFHGCGRFFLRRKCNFFRWFDPEVPDRQKKIIAGLLKKNNELKKKEKVLLKVIVILVVLLVLSVGVVCYKCL